MARNFGVGSRGQEMSKDTFERKGSTPAEREARKAFAIMWPRCPTTKPSQCASDRRQTALQKKKPGWMAGQVSSSARE